MLVNTGYPSRSPRSLKHVTSGSTTRRSLWPSLDSYSIVENLGQASQRLDGNVELLRMTGMQTEKPQREKTPSVTWANGKLSKLSSLERWWTLRGRNGESRTRACWTRHTFFFDAS